MGSTAIMKLIFLTLRSKYTFINNSSYECHAYSFKAFNPQGLLHYYNIKCFCFNCI